MGYNPNISYLEVSQTCNNISKSEKEETTSGNTSNFSKGTVDGQNTVDGTWDISNKMYGISSIFTKSNGCSDVPDFFFNFLHP